MRNCHRRAGGGDGLPEPLPERLNSRFDAISSNTLSAMSRYVPASAGLPSECRIRCSKLPKVSTELFRLDAMLAWMALPANPVAHCRAPLTSVLSHSVRLQSKSSTNSYRSITWILFRLSARCDRSSRETLLFIRTEVRKNRFDTARQRLSQIAHALRQKVSNDGTRLCPPGG
jgi:hypothetical protein